MSSTLSNLSLQDQTFPMSSEINCDSVLVQIKKMYKHINITDGYIRKQSKITAGLHIIVNNRSL